MIDPCFNAAMAIVLDHEGGFVDDPDDAGGATKYGISQRQYPDLDIAGLTVEKAKAIYFSDFWIRYRINQLPGVLTPCKVMDTAVLAGPVTAIKLLQRVLAALAPPCEEDGVIGPQTVNACRAADVTRILEAYRAALVAHYEAIVAANPQDAKFLKGWTARALS